TVIARRPDQEDKLARVALQQDSQLSQPRAPASGASTISAPQALTVPSNAPARAPQEIAGTASSSADKNEVQAEVARKDMREKKKMAPTASSNLADAASPIPAHAAKPAAAPVVTEQSG